MPRSPRLLQGSRFIDEDLPLDERQAIETMFGDQHVHIERRLMVAERRRSSKVRPGRPDALLQSIEIYPSGSNTGSISVSVTNP